MELTFQWEGETQGLSDNHNNYGSAGKESACNAGDRRNAGSILGQEDPLEKEMALHSSILAGRIPRTEEPGGLQSMGLQRVGHI